MARIRYEADGAIDAARFLVALTDFSDKRPKLWPNLDIAYYRLHDLGDTWAEVTEGTDVLGGIWAREHYDWSEAGVVRMTLMAARDFRPGTVIEYRVSDRQEGGCHVIVEFQRIATTWRGRLVGAVIQLDGRRRFTADLRETFRRLATVPASETAHGGANQ